MPIGHSFIELKSVDSSNNYAMGKVHAGKASHGTIFFAHEQSAGKGQRGKSWISSPGDNIMMSTVLEPVFLPITQQFSLSVAVALACHDFYSRHAGAEETRIKWPNDLYWRDRKAGGILIENGFRGDQWLFAVAGTGININQVQFPDDLRNPVSLRQITGRSFSAVDLARELGDCLERRFEQLRSETAIASGSLDSSSPSSSSSLSSPGFLLEEYNARLYRLGKSTRLRKDQTVFETQIQSVSPAGELITLDSLERRFTFGEVEWVG